MRRRLTQHALFYPLLMAASAAFMSCAPDTAPHYAGGTTGTLFHFLLIFAGTFLGYYMADLKPLLDTVRHRFVLNAHPLLYLVLSLLLFLFCILLEPRFVLLLQYLLAFLLTFLYYTNIRTPRFTFGGLRSVFLLKNISLALAWAFVTAPLHPGDAGSLHLFAFRFLYLLALSIGIDIRDTLTDRERNVKTLAVLAGSRNTKGIAIILLLAGLALVYHDHLLRPEDSLLLPALLSTACTLPGLLVLHERSSRNAFLWWIDGNLLLHGLLYFFSV